jgi:hypothetical protein
MKIFYKITISIAIASLMFILMSMPNSPMASLGEYLFGTHRLYLGTLLAFFGTSVGSLAIGFIWKEF